MHESARAMKLAMVACDLLTVAVLIAWLRSTRRSPWLALLYAWNPLVILEVAHSGHVDALGGLWIAVAAWMLSTDGACARRSRSCSRSRPSCCRSCCCRSSGNACGCVTRRSALVVLAALYYPIPIRRHPGAWRRPQRHRRDPVQRAAVHGAALMSTPQAAAVVAMLAGLAVGRVDARPPAGRRSGGMGMADGGLTRRRAGRLSVVPPLLHAIPLFTSHGAPCRLDRFGVARVYRLAPLASRTPVESPLVGHGRWVSESVLMVLVVPKVLKVPSASKSCNSDALES